MPGPRPKAVGTTEPAPKQNRVEARCRIARIAALALGVGVLLSSDLGGSQQGNMFSEAEKYERFMGRWSRRLATPYLKFAGVREGERVLDVGSGTGSLAFAIAAETRTAQVVGIDPSGTYRDFAAVRIPDPRIRFEVGDAQSMGFPSGSFDRCLSLLVVNFIPDARKAVDEMRRVTRAGGGISACVWDYGDGMEMLRKYWDAVVALDPATEPLDERNMRYCRKGELAALWRSAGLESVEETSLSIEMPFGSFDDYWLPFLDGQGPAGVYASQLGEARRTALMSRLRTMILNGRPDAPFVLRARAWAVRGRVPLR